MQAQDPSLSNYLTSRSCASLAWKQESAFSAANPLLEFKGMHTCANPSDRRAHLEWTWGPSVYVAAAQAGLQRLLRGS